MTDPMHQHGLRFRVVSPNGRKLGWALRDTLLPAMAAGAVVIDANRVTLGLPCHHLHPMAAGMMGTFTHANRG